MASLPDQALAQPMTGLIDVGRDVYHADQVGDVPTLSASIAKILCDQSPAHAKAAHPKLNPQFEQKEEQKFDVGNCAHALFLEGEAGVAVLPYDNWRTKAAQEDRDLARQHGKTPLLEKDWLEVEQMVAAMREQFDALECAPTLFTDGKAEQTLTWTDPEFGVQCRARLDWLRDDYAAIDDLKTTSRSANPDAWTRSTMWSIGADIQAAFYLRGLATLGVDRIIPTQFRFVVVETFAPYALSVVSLGPDALALGEKKVRYALDKWARCLANDSWPAYPTEVCFAECPAWMEGQWLEKELREAA